MLIFWPNITYKSDFFVNKDCMQISEQLLGDKKLGGKERKKGEKITVWPLCAAHTLLVPIVWFICM